MIARAYFVKNYKEIEEAEKLNLNIPEKILEKGDFNFRLNHVACCFKGDKGQIVIFLLGQKWDLEYNEDLWNKINEHLREN